MYNQVHHTLCCTIHISKTDLVAELKRCGNQRDLQQGKLLHSNAIQSGSHRNTYVANTLISMYSKCGSMQHARDVFQSMIHSDVVSWNALILGYVENGQSLVALELFNTMDCVPNRVTFVAALKACAGLATKLDKEICRQKGMNVHGQAKELGFHSDIFVANTLVKMYSKCGDIRNAHAVFDRMVEHNVVSWTALIYGYVENGASLAALNVFNSMDCTPDRVTFVVALKACASLATSNKEICMQKGEAIHRQARELGFDRDVIISNTLVDMYRKCGSMVHAHSVFAGMKHRDVVSWNGLILGYVENGESSVALELFNSMDCTPDRLSFVAALKACARMVTDSKMERNVCLQKATRVHRQAKELGFDRDVMVASTLVDMYSKCGDMTQARSVFDGMTQQDIVSRTALMLGYVENGESLLALELFNNMDCAPDRVTFVVAIKACAGLATASKELSRQKGVMVHRQARELGFERDVTVGNTLVDMYSKCGDMLHARAVFDGMMNRDVVSWNALILGYVENGESLVGLELFNSMGCTPDRVTFLAALKACAELAKSDKESYLQKGVMIHRYARELRVDKDVFVGNTLVDMYSKCGDMVQARGVFDGMVHRDVVSWTALIFGYVENGESSVALEVFNSMDCEASYVTFAVALKACGSLGALETGKRVHSEIRERGLESGEMVGASLVDFYGKCGDMDAAEEAFEKISCRNAACWTALMGGYTSLGNTPRVFSLAKRMEESGVKMDGVTVLVILEACNHAGLVEEGQMYFECMSKYGVVPTVEHYSCMVDMLGRANRLPEALSVLRGMPFEGDSVVWTALLGACRKWSGVGIGEAAFRALVSLNEDQGSVAAAHVLMRNIYEKSGMLVE